MLTKHVSWNLGELYINDDPTKIDDVGNRKFFNIMDDDQDLPDQFYFHTTQPSHYPYRAQISQREVTTVVFHEPDYELNEYETSFSDDEGLIK
jgi:hypothetical protein